MDLFLCQQHWCTCLVVEQKLHICSDGSWGPEKSLAALFPSLAELQPATRQIAPAFDEISAFTEVVTWESEGCTFNLQRRMESRIAKPEIKI